MSDTIDLDLVELRCKLRGWHVLYRYPNTGPASCIVLRQRGRLVWVRPGGATLRNGVPIDWPEITAPRWTLKKLLSDPPEGWRVAWSSREAAHFTHRSGAWLATDTELRDGCERVKGAQARAAAHRAIAGLLDLLAEVSDG